MPYTACCGLLRHWILLTAAKANQRFMLFKRPLHIWISLVILQVQLLIIIDFLLPQLRNPNRPARTCVEYDTREVLACVSGRVQCQKSLLALRLFPGNSKWFMNCQLFCFGWNRIEWRALIHSEPNRNLIQSQFLSSFSSSVCKESSCCQKMKNSRVAGMVFRAKALTPQHGDKRLTTISFDLSTPGRRSSISNLCKPASVWA